MQAIFFINLHNLQDFHQKVLKSIQMKCRQGEFILIPPHLFFIKIITTPTPRLKKYAAEPYIRPTNKISGRKPKYGYRGMLNAIIYLLRSGCS